MGTITRNAANNFTTGGVILPAAINDTSVASISELENIAAGGAMNLISEQTASASASISFTSGIDSTYPVYKFEFISMHPGTNNVMFQFNLSTDGGSNYNVTKTSTYFQALHYENDGGASLGYYNPNDLAQSTADQIIMIEQGNDADQTGSGSMFLFNPSSTTFVKHFIAVTNNYQHEDRDYNTFVGGYGNTTSAVNAVRFKFASGNIDSGIIKMYGIKDS